MTPLTLPAGMPAAIADVARAAGASRVETGGFIIGSSETSHGSVLALTGQADIERREHLFRVGGLALARLFDWTEECELSVLAQWHTHRYEAFLSRTDLEHGLNVPGFHTTVVPDYEQASPDPSRWGWWTYNGVAWASAPAPVLVETAFQTVTFEKGSVVEH